MSSSLRALIVILYSLALTSAPANAAEIHATSKVVAVTAYPRLAAITRAGKASLPPGAQTIIVGNMPAGFVESSLRVQGKGKAPVKIGSVEVKRVYLAELAAAAEQERAKVLQARRDEMAMIDADLKALQVKAAFIERMADKDAVAEKDKTSSLPPEKWGQAFGVVQANMAETQKDMVTKEIAKRKVQEEIDRLEKEYQQIKTSQRERRDVIIHVEASQETELDFTLTYQTDGVFWQPLYDARLSTEKGEIKLEQYGQIGQNTGEDWKDVEMVFSTARPDFGTEMPRLSEWYIQSQDEARRQATMIGGMKQKAGVSMQNFGAMMDASQEGETLSEPVQEPVASAPMAAEVAENGLSTEFRVPGRVDLKSVNEPSKFFIADQTMKASLLVKTTPRKSAQAYLFANIVNGEKYPLVPGMMAKYRDGAFMGNAAMKMLRPGEKDSLSFGVDDRVKVTFQKTSHKEVNPALVMIGDVSLERAYRSKVMNLHKNPIKIVVLDQYPVSRNPDIKVELQEGATTKGFVKDTEDRQGVIQWEADYQPQEEKVFDLAFTVKYPKGRIIPGL